METLQRTENVASFYEVHYHRFFIQVARFVSKRGGTLQHAEDLYHDALIIYYEKCMQPDFKLLLSEEAYITGIVKNLWSGKIKDELKARTITDEYNPANDELQSVDHQQLYVLLLSAGKKCLDLLSAFYHRKCTLTDIASAFGFTSEHSAAVQKYKCLEKIREIIKQNSLHHEDFLE